MKTKLHILHLEDDAEDAELVRAALDAGQVDCSVTRVQNREEFFDALENEGIDMVLADNALPDFEGKSALETVRAKLPDVPYIVVSGTNREEAPIQSPRGGVMDYVLKDRISRLVPVVRRAMKETEERMERQRLDEQMIQSQKMEVFGQLAAIVAHDFNNVLAVVLSYSDLLLSELSSDAHREFAETIRHAAERGTELTRQLLIFSRKQTPQAAVLDLNTVLQDMHKVLRRLIGEDIELTIVPRNEIGRIKADASHVWQMLMNLVANARDSMPHGGKLTIVTANVTLDEHHSRTGSVVTPGNYVCLSIRDTGIGMTDEVKAKLFQPFFTTKPKGKGAGLGLATCETIAKQCGSHIDVESETGKGATVKVYFPRVDQPPAVSTDSLRRNALPRGTETLLLVEDDTDLRDLARRVLSRQGYEVLCASNGQDGLDIARARTGSPIRLVITDVVMPQMGGKAMSESLRATHPNIKILFTSGYMEEALQRDGPLDAGAAFLAKPYTPSTLASKVRELLD